MKTDYANNQSTYATINHNWSNKIYYAHSIKFYNTQKELEDLKFLSTLKSEIVNPNGLRFEGKRSMEPYLLLISESDSVWYRGDTIGVIQEVLTALTLNKPVYSLETKKSITSQQISKFARIFGESPYCNNDRKLVRILFGQDVSEQFVRVLEGDFP